MTIPMTRLRLMTLALAACAMAAIAAFASATAHAQTIDDIVRRGRVIIAIDTSNPPWGFLDREGQPTGIDVEVARAIGREMHVPVEFVTINSPGRIPALLSNRVDMVLAVFSITPERALQVAFSIPYGGASSVLIAPRTRQIRGPQDLSGLRVGVTRGALEDGAVTAIAQSVPNITILRFDDGPSVASALVAGQIDAMGGGDYGEIYARRGSQGEEYEQKFPLRAAHFGIGIRRGNPDLLQWLNTFVYSVRNSGELDTLSRRFRDGAPMIPLPSF
jgi:polar amino acid transport system substrate-binding protein